MRTTSAFSFTPRHAALVAMAAAFVAIAASAHHLVAGATGTVVASSAQPAAASAPRTGGAATASLPHTDLAPGMHAFLESHCFECHDADTLKGDLDLTKLKFDLAAPQTFNTWVTVYDRVSAGEMPPKKKTPPPAAERDRFTQTLAASLVGQENDEAVREGRSTQRRLNRYEYESTLRDLLALPCLEVKDFLPEDTELHGYNKLGEALDVSHVHLARYLAAADFALHEAMAPQAARPVTTTTRYYTWDQPGFIKRPGGAIRGTFPLVGLDLQVDLAKDKTPKIRSSADPVRREQESTAICISTYEPSEISFNKFRAPITGKYRLKFSGYSIWMAPNFKHVTAGHRSEPVTIYSDTPPRLLRRMGSFDFDTHPTVCSMEVWLLAGETIRPDAARLYRDRPPDHKNPLLEADGQPGVAFQWMEVEGPIVDQWPEPGHKLMFGDLERVDRPTIAVIKKFAKPPGVAVVSKDPDKDAARLMRGFMQKAYRRPVAEADVERFLGVVRGALKAGNNFADSMIAGYTGVLSSPEFLYLSEKPGRLDDLALAERLSFFLWNSAPDEELRRLAAAGELHKPAVLDQQTDRLLADPRSRQFVNAFLDYWLDLRLIAGTAPDGELYPDYQLDDLLVESMTAEPQCFFSELIRRDLGATNLVDSDFVTINERLATHYGIPGVKGAAIRPVPVPRDSVRGGFLTQAAVLKVTANGTTTSPVKRGVWIMSRLLGKPPPPPPASVPAVEPDIRGAITIREQLAKHRTQESCNACHRNIDPAGFALESFDVMGAWRTNYRAVGGNVVKGYGHNGNLFHFSIGPPVDPSGELPDGRKFQNVRDLKKCLLQDPEQLARNLTQQLTVYATGAGIRFSDRAAISKILAGSKASGYGVRTIIHQIVQSDLFINK